MMRLVLAASLFCVARAFAAVPPLEETKWVRPDADIFALLTATPGECVGRVSAEDAYEINVGAVAFRSPFLFGGAAARAGLSCNSCHRDGRGNPDFHFEGLSGAPGTADVTSSIFSKTREDGEFNPVAIPDLVGIAGNKSFGTVSPHRSLDEFIERAVDEEFNGEAAPALIKALTAYVSRFEWRYCPPRGLGTNLWRDARLVRKALVAAREALRRNDAATADFLLLSARGRLGEIDRRFAVEGLEGERRQLSEFSARLGGLREDLRRDAAAAGRSIEEAVKIFDETEEILARAEGASLYDPAVLKKMLETDR